MPCVVVCYLIHRVHSRQLPQSGHTDHLYDKVSPEQVRQQLEHLELSVTHPHLSHQPGQGRVFGQEDGRVLAWSLLELRTRRGHLYRQSCSTTETWNLPDHMSYTRFKKDFLCITLSLTKLSQGLHSTLSDY